MPSIVVVVVSIGVVRGEQVDISVSSTKVKMTIMVMAPRIAGRLSQGRGLSPHGSS